MRPVCLALTVTVGLAAGCRSAPHATALGPTASPWRPASTTAGWSAPDPCSGLDGISTLETPVILEADCDPSSIACSADLALSVRNCSSQPIELQAVHLEEVAPPGGYEDGAEDRASVIYEPEHRDLLPGEAWAFETFAPVGSFELVAHVQEAAGPALHRQPLTVTHPRLALAQEQCTACDGDWGPHGMTGHVGCLCRTKDGGATCRDGLECEASCVSAGGGRYACSEFVTAFGCRSYLPDGWSLQPAGPMRRVPYRCVD